MKLFVAVYRTKGGEDFLRRGYKGGPPPLYSTPGKAKAAGHKMAEIRVVDTDDLPKADATLDEQQAFAEAQMLKWAARFDELKAQANGDI